MTSEILFEVSTSFLEARIPDSGSTALELSFLVECLESGFWWLRWRSLPLLHKYVSPIRVRRWGVGDSTNPWSLWAGWASSVREKRITVPLGLHLVVVKAARLLLWDMGKQNGENRRRIPWKLWGHHEHEVNFQWTSLRVCLPVLAGENFLEQLYPVPSSDWWVSLIVGTRTSSLKALFFFYLFF